MLRDYKEFRLVNKEEKIYLIFNDDTKVEAMTSKDFVNKFHTGRSLEALGQVLMRHENQEGEGKIDWVKIPILHTNKLIILNRNTLSFSFRVNPKLIDQENKCKEIREQFILENGL